MHPTNPLLDLKSPDETTTKPRRDRSVVAQANRIVHLMGEARKNGREYVIVNELQPENYDILIDKGFHVSRLEGSAEYWISTPIDRCLLHKARAGRLL